MPQYWLVIPAAGVGKRMQTADTEQIPKQYLEIRGKTIIELTLERLDHFDELAGTVVVLGEQDDWWPKLDITMKHPLSTTVGGEERAHSVYNGLEALSGKAADDDWVLVHDAVRPCVSLQDISNLIDKLKDDEVGGLLAAPVTKTLKKVGPDSRVEATVPREDYWLAATPQMFRYGLLKQALETALESTGTVTDEAHAMEIAGHHVIVVPGSADNIKITHPEDLFMAAQILHKQAAV